MFSLTIPWKVSGPNDGHFQQSLVNEEADTDLQGGPLVATAAAATTLAGGAVAAVAGAVTGGVAAAVAGVAGGCCGVVVQVLLVLREVAEQTHDQLFGVHLQQLQLVDDELHWVDVKKK